MPKPVVPKYPDIPSPGRIPLGGMRKVKSLPVKPVPGKTPIAPAGIPSSVPGVKTIPLRLPGKGK